LDAKEVLEWQEMFPNLELIQGFDEKAPFETAAADHTYLSDGIQNASRLTQFLRAATDRKMPEAEVKRRLASLMSSTFQNLDQLSEGLYLCGQYYVASGKVLSRSELTRICFGPDGKSASPAVKKVLNDLQNIFLKYLMPDPRDAAHLDVPSDTKDPSRNPLRQFYEEIQAVAHCPNPEIRELEGSYGNVVQMTIRLIFFKNVVQNWLLANRNLLSGVNLNLKFVPGFQPIAIDPSMTRYQILAELRRGITLMTKLQGEKSPRFNEGQLSFLSATAEAFSTLEPGNIPIRWID
jgi:hypothetical protein